jgi:enediyne biosynthesis protein E4
LVATQNIDSLKVFIKNGPRAGHKKVISLDATDSWAELTHSYGKKSRLEFYYGSGYLSQSTRKISIPSDVKEVVIHRYDGKSRTLSGSLGP